MKLTRLSLALAVLTLASNAWSWGYDHKRITRRVIEILPAEDLEMFGAELSAMGDNSLIPDKAFEPLPQHKERFVWAHLSGPRPDTSGRPFTNFHLMMTTPENLDVLLWDVTNAVNAAKSGNAFDCAGFAGVLAHTLEDWTTPAHTTVDDNMMGLLRTFLPPPEGSEFFDSNMHGRLEGGGFKMDDVVYQPRILAESAEELAYRLLVEAQAGQLKSRAQLIPILQAVYAGDNAASVAAQKIGGIEGLKLVADAYHTIAAIARGTAHREAGEVPLFECWPDETPGLYYPQSLYAGNPTWKPVLTRYYRKGKNVPEPDAWFFSPSGSRRISWTIPAGTFKRFTCTLTRHADQVSARPIEMHVRENGADRVVATLPMDQDSMEVVVPISASTTNFAIAFACGSSSDPKAPWTIWPIVKCPRLVTQ